MKYKIGDVARILGISTDLIRYYEEKGVVSPAKNPDNRYREFDTWDINYLIDCLWYKQFGFGIEQIAHMVTDFSYPSLLETFEERTESLRDEIRRKELLLERIEQFKQKLEDTKNYVGICELRRNAPFYYYINRSGGEYDSDESTRELSHKWLQYMPFTRRYFEFSEASMTEEEDEYVFGFSVRAEYVPELRIELAPPVQKMPPLLCFHSVFRSAGRNRFSARNVDYLVDFAQRQGFEPARGAFGNIACSVIEDGEQCGYFEVWLPVK